jgi:hypothetical protein
MRFYLGTHKLTPTLGMFGDLGWYPLVMYRKIEGIRLWNRLIEMSDNRLTKKMFLWDLNQCRNNWSAEIKKVFVDLDIEEYFTEMNVCCVKDASEVL